MNKKTDYSRLLDRAGKGDQEAFTEIYEATSQAIYRTVHAMVRDEELTLDIQQETYIQAFTHLDQLSSPDKLLPWLRAIAVNQTRTAMRKRQPILFSELSEDADAAEPEFPDESVESSPELSLDRKQTAELVRELLGQLTDAQRMLVGMYYYEQIPVRQIAADLGVSDGAVKTQLRRSRKKIETGVARLEQKGVKLYGAAPMPFLLALLSRLEPAAEESEKVLAGALTRSGAAKASVLHVGRRFTETVAGKVLLGLLAAGVIGGGAAAYSMAMTDRNLGDIRPTDTTHAIVMEHHDSNEDLPTVPVTAEEDPSETVTGSWYDTPEDLPTQPAATEPQPTAPQPTNPQPTNPQPTDPQPSYPNPTDPNPVDPTNPTSPQPTEDKPPEQSMAILKEFFWVNTGTSSIADTPWNLPLRVCARVSGSAVPVLSADNSSLLRIKSQESLNYTDYETGENYYFWNVTPSGSGTGHVFCSLNGETKGTLVLNNPVYEEKIVGWRWAFTDASSHYSCNNGETVWFGIWTQGKAVPTIFTDDTDVIRIVPWGPFEGEGVSWLVNGQSWKIQATGPGTATIYCVLNGQTVQTFTLTVTDPNA